MSALAGVSTLPSFVSVYLAHLCVPLTVRDHWSGGGCGERVGGEWRTLPCCSRSTRHVTYSSVGGSKGVAPFKVHLNTLMCYIMGFLPLYGFTNMINCIFLECSFYYPQDDFNITYSRRKCAQARLDRSAPCLGLSVYFIGSTVQTKLPPLKRRLLLLYNVSVSLLYGLYVNIKHGIALNFCLSFI